MPMPLWKKILIGLLLAGSLLIVVALGAYFVMGRERFLRAFDIRPLVAVTRPETPARVGPRRLGADKPKDAGRVIAPNRANGSGVISSAGGVAMVCADGRTRYTREPTRGNADAWLESCGKEPTEPPVGFADGFNNDGRVHGRYSEP